MHHYPHHIGDFNAATRHLTRVERSLYRDAIELYYDTEQPLNAAEFDRLCRRLIVTTDEERAALLYVLEEFFTRDGDLWRHARCDAEILKYKGNHEAASRAGRASAAVRSNGKATVVERPLNVGSTNQEPRTNNHSALIVREAPENPEAVDKSVQAVDESPPDGSAGVDEALPAVWAALCGAAPNALALSVLSALAREGCTSVHLRVAWAVARERKPEPERIPVAYVAPIVRDAMAGNLPSQRAMRGENGASARAWMHDDKALEQKALVLGITARMGESYEDLRRRAAAAIEAKARGES